MQLHARRDAVLWTGATREYALKLEPLDDDHESPKRSRRERTCPVCGARLSAYNLDRCGLCRPCQKRGDEPLTATDWQKVFEGLVGALCAPWEVDSDG